MKPTDAFRQTIKAYLDNRAKEDELFAKSYAKEKKTLDDCITYILNTVKNSDCNGFADEEIYSMAVHYYDEDNLEVGKPISVKVVVNHTVELTEEDREQAKREAMDKVRDEAIAQMYKKPAKPKAEAAKVEQASLF